MNVWSGYSKGASSRLDVPLVIVMNVCVWEVVDERYSVYMQTWDFFWD